MFNKFVATIFLMVSFVATPAAARVFSFENETVAPYVNLRGGISSMGSTPFRWQSASTYGGDEVDLIYGGEFGLYLRMMGFGMAMGVLVHTYDPVTGATASDASGNQLFSLDSEAMAYGASVVFDYQFGHGESYMWKFFLGGGYQFAKIENTYNFSTDGQALVNGQTSLTESYKSESPFAVVGIGTEFVMSGSATINLSLGYHYSLGNAWSYGQGGENFAGTHSQGASVVFEDGSSRTIDWSYAFLQLGFNFYVDTVR